MKEEMPRTAAAVAVGWPRDLHRWSTLLVLVVFPLIWVGGLVTTSDAGMAVPDWPGTYGSNLFLYPVYDWFFGPWDLFVEHGHRLLASLAGILTIVVFVLAWRGQAQRRDLFWLCGAALLMVVVQGVLGGLRVVLDERTLALVHGCAGPVYFTIAVAIWCLSSRWWTGAALQLVQTRLTRGASMLRLTVAVLATSMLQLVIGANLRHVQVTADPFFYQHLVQIHLALAAALVIGSGLLVWVTHHRACRDLRLGRFALLLVAAIVIQVALGGATWIVKFGWPWLIGDLPFASRYVIDEKSFLQMNVVTAHGATGSLILAILTVMACRAARGWQVVNVSGMPRPAEPTGFRTVQAGS